ncbi:hypothetical protein ACA910_011725 [Epithemia clementina (nom. ined.)]
MADLKPKISNAIPEEGDEEQQQDESWTKVESGAAAAAAADEDAPSSLLSVPVGDDTAAADTTTTTTSPFKSKSSKQSKANPLKDLHSNVVRPALDKASASMRQVTDKASASMRQVKDKAGASMRQVTEKASASMRHVTDKASASMRQVSDKASASMRQVKEHVGQTLQKAGPSVRQMTQQVSQVTVQKSRELSLGTQMAVAAATASTAHTFGQIGSHPLEEAEDGRHKVKGESTDGWVTGAHEYGIQALCVIGFVSALTSMILIVGHLSDICSLLTMVICPMVFWQKTQLKSLGGMRGQQNALREKVNTLTAENSKLSSSIDTMERQVEQLKHVEAELDSIAKKAGGQVDRIVNIVHENGELQRKIRSLLDDEVLQQIITAILTTDRDGDYSLNPMERRQLEYRLKNIPGIIFHPDRFEAYCASDDGDLTLADVMKIARNLEDPTVPPEKCIFEYKITKELANESALRKQEF